MLRQFLALTKYEFYIVAMDAGQIVDEEIRTIVTGERRAGFARWRRCLLVGRERTAIQGDAQQLSCDFNQWFTCVRKEQIVVGQVTDGIVGEDDVDQRCEQRQGLSRDETGWCDF